MKCLALLACEKVIIDKEGAHSLINIMLNASVTMQPLPGQLEANQPQPPIPVAAITPTQWWMYSIWDPSADDIGKAFEQVYQVYWPNGEKLYEGRLPFVQKDAKMNQTTYYLVGFPVGQEGKVRIVTWLDSQGYRVSDIIESYVGVGHGQLPINTSIPALQ